jgi:hypothetical protein
MPNNNSIFEQYGKWNTLKYENIVSNVETPLLKFCYNYDVDIIPTNKHFKKLYIYFLLKKMLKIYKENWLLSNKIVVLTPIKDSYIIKNHWNETEYTLFLRKIFNTLSKNLPLNICILPDSNIDDRLNLCKSIKYSHKKIIQFIHLNDLEKIEDQIYSIILSS